MAITYKLIQSLVVNSNDITEMTFSSIPQIYTDLTVKFTMRGSMAESAYNVALRVNSNTDNIYQTRRLYAGGSAQNPTTYVATNQSTSLVGLMTAANDTVNTFSNCEFYIPNYTSSNYKTIGVEAVHETNANAAYMILASCQINTTSAISSINLFTTGTTYTLIQGTTAYLYGISKS